MKLYVIAMYQADGPPPPPEILGPIMRDVEALRQDMQDAGVWVFSGGLLPPSSATVLRMKGDEVLISDGPYVEGKEHLGGFTIIAVPDLDAALAWGERMVRAVPQLPVEVRPFAGDVT